MRAHTRTCCPWRQCTRTLCSVDVWGWITCTLCGRGGSARACGTCALWLVNGGAWRSSTAGTLWHMPCHFGALCRMPCHFGACPASRCALLRCLCLRHAFRSGVHSTVCAQRQSITQVVGAILRLRVPALRHGSCLRRNTAHACGAALLMSAAQHCSCRPDSDLHGCNWAPIEF